MFNHRFVWFLFHQDKESTSNQDPTATNNPLMSRVLKEWQEFFSDGIFSILFALFVNKIAKENEKVKTATENM